MKPVIKLFLAAILLAGMSFATTLVSNCRNLDNITDTEYALSADLYGVNNSMGGESCISMNSSNIIFDCDGYNITDDTGSSTSMGINLDGYSFARLYNITVRNCPGINNYSSGIMIKSTSHSLFTNNSAYHSGDSYEMYESSNNTFTGNLAYDSSSRGFLLSNAYENIFIGNMANQSGVDGFYMGIADDNYFYGNIVSEYENGFRVDTCARNRFVNNAVFGNNNGFDMLGGNSNNLTNNTVYGNIVSGIWLDNANGTIIESEHYYDNTADLRVREIYGYQFSYTLDGIIIDNPAGDFQRYTNLSLTDTVGLSEYYAMEWSSDPASHGLFYSFEGKFVDITAFSGTPSIESLSWSWLASEESGYETGYLGLWEYDGAWTLINNSADTVGRTLSIADLNPSSVYAILENRNCPVVNASGSYQMARDYIGAPNDASHTVGYACVVLAASDILFDCNAFDMTNNGTGSSVGVLINDSLSNVTIQDCPMINGYQLGLQIFNSSNNYISNNVVFNCTTGFALSAGSENNTLSSNLAYGNAATGFYLGSADNNIFIGNTAANNSVAGFEIEDSPGCILTDNIVYGNDDGIGIKSGSDPASFTGGRIYNNTVGLNVSSSNLTTGAGIHLYGNSYDMFVVDAATLDLSGMVFDNPAGDFTGYSNLSIVDTQTAGVTYSISWTTNSSALPADTASFAEKFLNISIIAGSPSLDSLVWHWDDSEVAGDEARFQLWKYNASDGWTMLNDTPDTAGNTLALADLASFSDFAILEDTSVPPTSQGDEKSSQPKEDLSISVSTACDGFIVTVRDDPGALVEDAFVEVVDNTHQSELDAKYTDSSGKVYFSPCDIDAEIQVSKSGAKGYRSLHIGCGLCGECQSDDDCDDASYCLDNGCVPVQCPAGQVVKDHRCGYQCVEDADCAPGQTCSGNRCVYGCYSDDMCSASQYCDIPEGEAGGVCTEIECGCGVIGEHACAEFECCADSDCGLGEVCVSNKCALAGLTCPSTGIVGDEKTCNARQDGDICAGCDYQIRAPDGKTYMGKTDQDGNLIIPLDLRGVYTVTLFKDGQVLRTTQVESLPRPIIGEPERPVSFIEAAQALFLVILVAVMLVVLTYIRRRGGEKLKRPKA